TSAVGCEDDRLAIVRPVLWHVEAVIPSKMLRVSDSCPSGQEVGDVHAPPTGSPHERESLAVGCRAPAADAESGPVCQAPGLFDRLAGTQIKLRGPIVAGAVERIRLL